MKAFRRDHGDGDKKPACFISYAWGDRQHERWVEQLADHLQNADVSVALDRWHNTPATSVTRYIERIEASDFVCALGTPRYLQKDQAQDMDPVVQAELRLIKSKLTRLRGLAAQECDFECCASKQAIELMGLVLARVARMGCSEDLPYSLGRVSAPRFVPSCFCGRPDGARTARRTSIGTSSKSASRRWPGGAATGSVSGRDPFVAGRRLASSDRGIRHGVRRAANASAVPRGSLRGGGR